MKSPGRTICRTPAGLRRENLDTGIAAAVGFIPLRESMRMAKSKQDYAGIDNRKRIIDKATELFIEQGAQETSLSDIARALGISKGTLYYYYSSKADLIFDVTDIYMEKLTTGLLDWVKGLEDRSSENVLQVLFQRVFTAKTRGKLHIYLIHEAITHNPQIKEKIQHAYARWKEMLREGLQIAFGDALEDTYQYADLILTVLTGGIVHSILELDTLSVERLVEPLMPTVS
jgi:TetR/AcrR family acrAB operon transcriptional repressor